MPQREPTLSERLADDIVDIIRTDRLVPGDALASSRELARRFAVTTPTVREALRRLEATGAVEFRHGSGTYVGSGIDRRLLANPHRPGIDRDAVLELVEARLVVEPSIAAAAADARESDGLAQLDRAVTNALEPQQGSERPAVHFHVALAATAGNTLLRETVEALLHVRVREQIEIRHSYDDRGRDHAEHQQILAAVRAGDAEQARALTHEHLVSIRDVVRSADLPERDR
ncbi:DNA-binding FadR family transcriptional regulator [Prauserella isguenensis]|uniref:DNA-binding FadR family transcriptional regulator n=1 Tax=Prauserella isguenensis TaxID=1470180 RepID=A0A839S0R5_9PSEU|nr:GntR family transcriptional regulator [Prauserella isguenensis]MBB3051661.1 DNA-binding FadR family transcriptional regulator [Prauserella isguenensis]